MGRPEKWELRRGSRVLFQGPTSVEAALAIRSWSANHNPAIRIINSTTYTLDPTKDRDASTPHALHRRSVPDAMPEMASLLRRQGLLSTALVSGGASSANSVLM